MAWKPTPKPTPTWSNPTSKRPPASTSAGGRTGAAPAGPLAHPPARPPTLLPRRHLAPPRGIVPGSSSWTRRLAHRSERITWDAPPRDIVLGVLSCIVAPNTSLRTRRSRDTVSEAPSHRAAAEFVRSHPCYCPSSPRKARIRRCCDSCPPSSSARAAAAGNQGRFRVLGLASVGCSGRTAILRC